MIKKEKGFVHTDYVIAIGIFIAMFGMTVVYLNNYMTQIKQASDGIILTDNAYALLAMADFEESPMGWPELGPDESAVLLLHFRENNTSPGGLVDSARGINGTATGSPIFNITGRFGSSWTLRGNSYLTFPDNDSWAFGSEPFTIELWTMLNSTGNVAFIGTSEGGGGNKWAFLFESGNLRFLIGRGGGNVYPVQYEWTPEMSRWYHLAITRSGFNYTLYVDGIAAGSGTDLTAIPNVNAPLIMGQLENSNYLGGSLDEIAIYNRSLSGQEILGHGQPERRLERMGLKSKEYVIYVRVSNEKNFLYNQSANVTDLVNEVVSFNISGVVKTYDPNSVNVYDDGNGQVPHQQVGNNLSFVVPYLGINETRWYRVYASEDGVFPSRSISVEGTDSLRETVLPKQEIDILGNFKIRNLGSSNYTILRNAFGLREFRIVLRDIGSGSNYMILGDEVPRRGNVVALQKFYTYQDNSGGIRPGRLTIQTW